MSMSADHAEHHPYVVMDDDYGMIQVVVPPSVQAKFIEWLASRGLNLCKIPTAEGDLPTYGIGLMGGQLYETRGRRP